MKSKSPQISQRLPISGLLTMAGGVLLALAAALPVHADTTLLNVSYQGFGR